MTEAIALSRATPFPLSSKVNSPAGSKFVQIATPATHEQMTRTELMVCTISAALLIAVAVTFLSYALQTL